MKRRSWMSLAECRDCHAPIRFVALDNGKIPVNPVADPRGNVAAFNVGGQLHGHVISRNKLARPGMAVYMPHAATCPERPRKPVRTPPPTLFDNPEE